MSMRSDGSSSRLVRCWHWMGLDAVGLTLHLSPGRGMDRESAAAWVASDAGREFMRRSGEAWCRAQIDSGEDADAARAASERCIAAYLGEPG